MSLFSFIGTALGVAVLILVMGVMTGFHNKLLDKILSFNAHVSILSPTDQIIDYEKPVQQLKQSPHVKSVLPVIEGQGLLIDRKRSHGIIMRGYDQNDFEQSKALSKKSHQRVYSIPL